VKLRPLPRHKKEGRKKNEISWKKKRKWEQDLKKKKKYNIRLLNQGLWGGEFQTRSSSTSFHPFDPKYKNDLGYMSPKKKVFVIVKFVKEIINHCKSILLGIHFHADSDDDD
jgi:hypothetical protein